MNPFLQLQGASTRHGSMCELCSWSHTHMRKHVGLHHPAPSHYFQGSAACKMLGCPVEMWWVVTGACRWAFILMNQTCSLYCWFRERHTPQAGVHYCAITFLLLFIQKSQIPENSRGEEFCFILATSQLIPSSEELHSIKQTGNVWLLSNPLGSSPSSESKLYISARAWQPAALMEWWETHRICYQNTWVSPSSATY